MAAIDGAKRSANVTALTKVEACIMPASVFKSIIFSSPAICERLLTLMTTRMRASNARLFERSVLDLRHRLYAELLRLARPRHGVEGQSIISPPPLQQDLAARIGCRREQISREIHAMIEEGLAEKAKGGLVILHPKLLENRISAKSRRGGLTFRIFQFGLNGASGPSILSRFPRQCRRSPSPKALQRALCAGAQPFSPE